MISVRLIVAAVTLSAATLLAGCVATSVEVDSPSTESSAATDPQRPPAGTPSPAATATNPDEGDAPLDRISLGQQCAEIISAQEWSQLSDFQPDLATAASRPDGLIFVTLPAAAPALSGGEEISVETDAYCYLEPDTFDAYVSRLGYVAVGSNMNIRVDEYDLLFNADEPIDSLLD